MDDSVVQVGRDALPVFHEGECSHASRDWVSDDIDVQLLAVLREAISNVVRHAGASTADCSPVFSIAGVMPGSSEMAWKTAYPNPDASLSGSRHGCRGPAFSIAGVMPGGAQMAWRTAMPDPTRDMLDADGHVVSIAEGTARAEIAHRAHALALRGGAMSTPRHAA
ncbi:MAG TPA: hypothetical protein VF711_12625 [Acidimicrobiales bacterium]